jgi:GMP synthase-like glutamine amidotransferase
MNLHILQHVVFETPGTILDWARENGHAVHYTLLFEERPIYPTVKDIDMLVIMGGPMAVYEADTLPWMAQEKRVIAEVIAAGKIVLGICLGAQLLAEALGAKVYPHHTREIGFFPIEITPHALTSHLPPVWTVLHWHGDTFDLPEGAELLASSAACAHQGFVKGRCVGLQFHPEADADLIKAMVQHEGYELLEDDFVQTEAAIHFALANKVAFMALLDKIIRLPLPHET